MASAPIRDQVGDHLITPPNSALVLIDYQPSQFGTVRSMDPDLLLKNIVSTVKTARAFGLPIRHLLGGPPRRHRPCRSGWGRPARMGLAGVRATARLEPA